MPLTLREKLAKRSDRIDYEDVVDQYPWIVARDQNCILSPDSDGFLCGLFMSTYLNWNIVGFYDGKVLVKKKGETVKNCVFLDMEIFRKGIRSVGQHMLMYNKDRLPSNWEHFKECFSINNLRRHDTYHDFRLKYPFATIHFLIGVLSSTQSIKIKKSAIAPLLFTDGTWMNLLGYTENSLSWLKYLRADEDGNPLKTLFLNEHYSIYSLMNTMDNFFSKRDEISAPRERGDRLALTLRGGEGTPHNLEKIADVYTVKADAKQRAEKFIRLLSETTGWNYLEKNWLWEGWELFQFTKGDFLGDKKRLNNVTYTDLISRNPLSFAITSGQNIIFTLEDPDKLS